MKKSNQSENFLKN